MESVIFIPLFWRKTTASHTIILLSCSLFIYSSLARTVSHHPSYSQERLDKCQDFSVSIAKGTRKRITKNEFWATWSTKSVTDDFIKYLTDTYLWPTTNDRLWQVPEMIYEWTKHRHCLHKAYSMVWEADK